MKIPEHPSAVIILCLGSEDSRFCPRIHFITQQLQRRGFATFIFDILSKEEGKIYSFNPSLAVERLIKLTRSLKKLPEVRNTPIGYLGTGSGTATAVAAAASLQRQVSTIVSCSGYPNPAEDHLAQIEIPVLLIAGQLNTQTVASSRQTLHNLSGTGNLAVIVQETIDLFDEERVLEQVTEITSEWFTKHLAAGDTGKRQAFPAMAS